MCGHIILGRTILRVRRVTTRLTGAAVAALVGGGFGAMALSPATAGAAARTPVTAVATTKAAAAACATGKYQKQVETYLKKLGGFGTITVDGKQSPADCAAIKKFQKRFGIQPAAGLAGSPPRTSRPARPRSPGSPSAWT
jgi:peptidoglycan hydrolase-like protein with peptidoglycan-binding domain